MSETYSYVPGAVTQPAASAAEPATAPAGAPAPVQPAPAPVAAQPNSNPAEASSSVEAQPGQAPAPAQDTTPAQAQGQESTPLQQSTSLLSEGGAEAAKPKADQQPAQDPAQQQAPVTYEPFKLPEGVQLDDGRLKTFTATLGEFRAPQDLGQKLMDMHVAEMRSAAEQISRQQYEVWEKTQNEWKDAVKADPELGGNRYETTLASCRTAIRSYGGSEQQQTELLNALTYTGAGNNPAIIRLIANMAHALKEGAPAPQAQPRQNQGERGLRRYNTGTS